MEMTCRQRTIETLRFGQPDRVPFQPGGPRRSTMEAWHGQGLPDHIGRGELMAHLWDRLSLAGSPPAPAPDVNVDFRMMPRFAEKVIERRNGHLIVQDWKGNVCEISDEFSVADLRDAVDFVTRRWIRCPVESRQDWQEMQSRYDPADPSRIPDAADPAWQRARGRDGFWQVAFPGCFWQLREWLGFEQLCMAMLEQPDWVEEMARFWSDFVADLLRRLFARAAPDAIWINEDMAYKEKAMISPAMTRRFCMPAWQRWASMARSAGVPIIAVDSDGFVGELIPLWIEAGVNACDPMEVAAGNDIVAERDRYGQAIAFRGGVDKRAMARGGEDLASEMRRIEPVVRSGGYIPGCDHGVPADVSWPNFLEYCRLLAEMTGWR